jgi:uroporphyrinogen decarboxylase
MTPRERFAAILRYQPVDRCPIMNFGFWSETRERWASEGLPVEADADAFFGFENYRGAWPNLGLCPGFADEVVEDRGDSEIVRQGDGAIVERSKRGGSIPRHLGHALTDRASWEQLFKPRLQAATAARWSADWPVYRADFIRPDRAYPLIMNLGSLYGVQRNWFGLERVSEVLYDDLGLIEEIATTLADVAVHMAGEMLRQGIRPEVGWLWEDICYNAGPLIAPRLFKRIIVPQLRRITAVMEAGGVDLTVVDCDGKIDALIPLWMGAGVKGLFPIEIGTTGCDPVALRRTWGRELRMLGGFDKRILARTPADISREVERLAPLVEEGGFIPQVDHLVPPDVPLANFLHYVREAKRVWGRGRCLPTGRSAA